MALRSISCARPGISLRSRAYQAHRPLSVVCQSTQPEGPKVTFDADISKLTDAMNSQQFKEELSPLRAYCEPAPDGEGVKLMVVSKAFEGKKARGRERLVLKALGQGELDELNIVAMTPSESAAMLKKWC